MVNKFYDLAVAQPEIPDSVRKHYLALKHHAGESQRQSANKRETIVLVHAHTIANPRD